MKKKADHKQHLVTEQILDERFYEFEKKIDKKFTEQDEKAREYRDNVLNKLDELLGGELVQIREDQVFMDADIKDVKKRVTNLESSQKVD